MRKSSLAVLAALLLSGCNTYSEETFQRIIVQTPGVDNVECSLETKTNSYKVLTTRDLSVERSEYPMIVTCDKAGYETSTLTVEPQKKINNLVGNIWNGIVPGAAYDIASNSIYAYPDTIVVTMQPKPGDAPVKVDPYVLPKKEVEVAPAPAPVTPAQTAPAEKALSKGLKK